jgi:sugar phosphate permease
MILWRDWNSVCLISSWVGVLGTLIFGVVTIWFFIAARGWVLVGFMVVIILFGFVWQIATRRLKNSN